MSPSKSDKNFVNEEPIEMDEGGILRLEDENRMLRNKIKEVQRETTLFQSLAKVIKEQPPFSSYAPYKPTAKKGKILESCVALWSDWHLDQEILPERVQNLESFNFEAGSHRFAKLIDTTISHLTENMTNYSFERLYIFNLGDMTNGDIHGASEYSKWGNSLKSSLGVGELMSLGLVDLFKVFKEIVYCGVSGNHCRRSVKKQYVTGAHDNFDFLTSSMMCTRLKPYIDAKRLKVFLPDSWSAMVKIYDWNFLLNHGDDLKSWNTIPFYAIERATRRLTSLGAVTNNIPNYFCYGHYHQAANQSTALGSVVMNGSFQSCSEYSINALGAYNVPSQTLFGVHRNYGKTWELPIYLRNSSNWMEEEKKPPRYRITLFDDIGQPL